MLVIIDPHLLAGVGRRAPRHGDPGRLRTEVFEYLASGKDSPENETLRGPLDARV